MSALDAPTLPPKRQRISWVRVGVLSFVGALGVLLAWVALGPLAELSLLRNHHASWEQYEATTTQHIQQFQAIRQSHEELFTKYQQLVADRDNLLVQVKRLMEEQEQLSTDRDLYEGVLKRVSQEDHLLREQLESLHQARDKAEQLADDVLVQRNALQERLQRFAAMPASDQRLKRELVK